MHMLHDVSTADSTTLLRSSVSVWTQIFLDTAPCGRDKKKYQIQKCFRIQAIQVPCGLGLKVCEGGVAGADASADVTP